MTNEAPESGTAQTCGALLIGIDAKLIDVQASISPGPPGFTISGVPDDQTWQMRDRVRAAAINSGLAWPTGDITVRVGPAHLDRYDCGLDLPIAAAIAAAAGQAPAGAGHGCVFAAELSLDGHLRPVRGIVPVLTAAATAGGPVTAMVAPENWPEAAMRPGVVVAPCESLRQVVAWLRGEYLPWEPLVPASARWQPGAAGLDCPGLARLGIPPAVRQVIEVAAAGGHHLCLVGRRPAGIPALAARLASMLPELDERQADEVTAVHSAAGLLRSGRARITRPPLRVPHHTARVAAMIGGGRNLAPGEAPLAHHGVLCVNDAPDFGIDFLGALRQPLQDREIVLARAGATARFPARFILLAGMCRCPCGGRPGCACTPLQVRRYQQRLTGTLGTWIPLRLIVDPSTFTGTTSGEFDAVSAARVEQARERMAHRLAATPWRVNGDVPRAELRRTWPPAAAGRAVLDRAVDLGMVSSLAAGQITGVAWTLADLAGKPQPGADECARALALCTEAGR